MGSAKTPIFEAPNTLSQATGSQEGPRIGQKLGQVVTGLFVPVSAQDQAPTSFSSQQSDSGKVPSMSRAKAPDFEISGTLSQARGPQEGPMIRQKLGQEITRLFLLIGVQDQARTTLSIQE